MKKHTILLAILVLGLTLLAQEIQEEAVAINIEVPVRVFKGKKFIDNLTIDDFEIYEDGILQITEAAIPKTDTIEKELWNLINKERKLDNLPLLELSSALSAMARQHSLDMASQGKANPSHLSSSGKSLINRLEDADFYYIEAGENVAFSETFEVEFIHESIIGSIELIENILNPNFTQIGIGIIHFDNKGYYITQDFLQPLLIKTHKEVSQIVMDHINTERRLMALPSLDLRQQADRFAQNSAERKAIGQPLRKIPPQFGETYIVFLSTPSLTQEEIDFPDAVNPRYNIGALGIWFGKNRDYPGGVYVFALMLFADNSYQHRSGYAAIRIRQ